MQQPKILDNKKFGKIGDEIKEHVKIGSKVSVVSAYFTIYAYKELVKDVADEIEINIKIKKSEIRKKKLIQNLNN